VSCFDGVSDMVGLFFIWFGFVALFAWRASDWLYPRTAFSVAIAVFLSLAFLVFSYGPLLLFMGLAVDGGFPEIWMYAKDSCSGLLLYYSILTAPIYLVLLRHFYLRRKKKLGLENRLDGEIQK